MQLPRELIRTAPLAPYELLRFDRSPIQAGLRMSPWHVACASILLCRAKRIPHITRAMFAAWGTPQEMEASDVELELLLRPTGLHRNRARAIQQLSRRWYTDSWSDMRELNGVGQYVADAVQLFCFGCVGMNSQDEVLHSYAQEYAAWSLPKMMSVGDHWLVDSDVFPTAAAAYEEFLARLGPTFDGVGV